MRNIFILASFLVGCTSTSGGQTDGGFTEEEAGFPDSDSNQDGTAGSTSFDDAAIDSNNSDTNSCVPKTCTTIGIELNGEACGIANDGCGNYINCDVPEYFGDPEGCSDPLENCGETAPNADGTAGIGIENLCGGGCSKQDQNTHCKPNGFDYEYKCNSARDSFINSSNESCTAWQDTTPNIIWCCTTE